MNLEDIKNRKKLLAYMERREQYHNGQIELANLTGNKEEYQRTINHKEEVMKNLRKHYDKKNWMNNPEDLN